MEFPETTLNEKKAEFEARSFNISTVSVEGCFTFMMQLGSS